MQEEKPVSEGKSWTAPPAQAPPKGQLTLIEVVLTIALLAGVAAFFVIPALKGPPEVQRILENIRNGKPAEYPPPELDLLERWLTKQLVKGKTTKADIVSLLGAHSRNKPEPQANSTETIIYPLLEKPFGQENGSLDFQFDRNTGILSKWELFRPWID